MAECAGNPYSRETTIVVKGGAYADDRVLPEQLLRSAGAERIVDEELEQVQPIHVDLETETERLEWLDLSRDDLVQASGVGPVLLVAERVIAKDLSALALEIAVEPRIGKLATS